ncbi:MAG: hypothetical protein AAFU85_19480 [Planctomycetota bacterium]
MNRYLFVPLVITLVGFAWVWSSQHSRGERVSVSVETRDYEATPIRELLPSEQAEAMILKDWPTISPREVMSRVAPRRSYHVALIAEPQRHAGSDFLWDLQVTVNWKDSHYPIHVDRISGLASVFADNVWQPYETWRLKSQAQHEHLLTGKRRSDRSEAVMHPEALQRLVGDKA